VNPNFEFGHLQSQQVLIITLHLLGHDLRPTDNGFSFPHRHRKRARVLTYWVHGVQFVIKLKNKQRQ
jgi:hypothetical protein